MNAILARLRPGVKPVPEGTRMCILETMRYMPVLGLSAALLAGCPSDPPAPPAATYEAVEEIITNRCATNRRSQMRLQGAQTLRREDRDCEMVRKVRRNSSKKELKGRN